jgi:hypothetical protein
MEGSVGVRLGLTRSWRISRTDMVRVGVLGLRRIDRLSSFKELNNKGLREKKE